MRSALSYALILTQAPANYPVQTTPRLPCWGLAGHRSPQATGNLLATLCVFQYSLYIEGFCLRAQTSRNWVMDCRPAGTLAGAGSGEYAPLLQGRISYDRS